MISRVVCLPFEEWPMFLLFFQLHLFRLEKKRDDYWQHARDLK